MSEGTGGPLEGPGDTTGAMAGALGGLDMGALLEQAQQMQQQLAQAQTELAATEITGDAGGVAVTVNGTGELVRVEFDEGSIERTDDEARADLGDLVVAAYRDAKTRADALAADKLGPLAGGLGGPGGGLGGLGGV